jgi:ABC-type multidrug transport system ATPase subunit
MTTLLLLLRLIFCCSGLDSFAALSVMGHLQHVAQATHQTVIATIHQPRQAIWEMFDTVSHPG